MKKPYFNYKPLAHQVVDSGLSRFQFCQKLEVDNNSVGRALNGQQDLAHGTIYKICQGLKCQPSDIMAVTHGN